MKKTFFLLITTFATLYLHAKTLDSANFECIYKLDYVMDLLKADKSKNDEMRLLIGDNYTQYHSYTNYTTDSLQNANPEEYKPQVLGRTGTNQQLNVVPPRTMLKKSDNIEVFNINRKSGELMVTGSIIPRQMYKYEEKLQQPEWEITPETDSVLGYICQKATTRYAGRNWTVWFAPEIAINEGPWKLRGLPGLVLKAEDDDKHYVFECTALQRLKTKKAIDMEDDKECRKVSKKEFYKQRQSFFEDPVSALNKNFEGSGAKISVIKTNDEASLIRKYNPIELE